MNVSSFNIGLSGIQKGFEGINKAAQEIVSTTNVDNVSERAITDNSVSALSGRSVSLAESLIDLKTNIQLVESSAKVVQASNDTLGSLLDILV